MLRIIFLTVALDLIGFGMVVPLLPLYARDLGATGTQVALLFASYSGLQFLFSPIWGRLSDAYGRRRLLLGLIAGNTLAMVFYAQAQQFHWLLLARVWAGICAANIAVAQAFVADVTSPEERSRGMGLIGAAFGLGFVLGPFLGGELSRWGHAAPAYAAAGLGAINFVWAWRSLPESLPVSSRRPLVWRSRHLWRLYDERFQVMRSGAVPSFLLVLIFTQIFGFSMMEVSLVLFTKIRLHLDAVACGRCFGYLGLVLVAMQGGLTHRLTQRFGEARLIIWGMGCVATALLAIPYTPEDQIVWLFPWLTLMAIGQGLLSPSLNSLLSKHAPANAQGSVLGLGQSLSSLARVLGPQIGGIAFDWGGENWPFWLGGGVIAIAFGGAWNYFGKKQQ